MLLYAITIFLSAFLLFQVQPMIAKFILPWFGGTAAVWTTCMMFFQVILLAGYSYAHWLRRTFPPRTAWSIHLVLLAAAALTCNIYPDERWQPTGEENLTLAILIVLAVTIGLPFFVLSTTGPLVQAWQSTSHQGSSPYRLYALSNLGSMLALITYPFLFERWMSLVNQSLWWSASFLAFAGFCGWSGWQTVKRTHWGGDFDASNGAQAESANISPVGFVRPIVWVMLTAAASIMLVATTNLMCQEVAAVPFLWILPLSLYLLSFIICFDRPRWYKRRVYFPLMVVSAFVAIALVHLNAKAGFILQVVGLSIVCFSSAMICHGELERLKPHVRYLTLFYLLVAVGGAVGGIFVAVVAPHIFTGFYEFHLALLICLLVPLGILIYQFRRDNQSIARPVVWGLGFSILIAATFVVCSIVSLLQPNPTVLYKGRNEYGLVSIVEYDNYRKFINGQIHHGGQFTDPVRKLQHNSYYVEGSGVSIAFDCMREFLAESGADRGLQVGILGLGAGGMMTWSKPGDRFDFYEINPLVEKIARNFFSYLSDGMADSQVILGDGRVQLEKHAEEGGVKYDLIFMDAFASDSIPIHLITTECFDVYCRNLTKEGIIVAHISNRYVDLIPVVYQAALDQKMTPILIKFQPENDGYASTWVLMTSNPQILQCETIQQCQSPWPEDLQPVRWTDDFASLAAQIDWSWTIDWKTILKSYRKTEE
jgi:hypothetical protein